MPLITIIGAGPGLGLEIARAFGQKGFDVALVARDRSRVDALAAQLTAEGIQARGFTADVGAPDTIRTALRSIRETLGPIDVLEFSPADRDSGVGRCRGRDDGEPAAADRLLPRRRHRGRR